MGFNKRYINKESLSSFRNKKSNDLVFYLTNPDCIIIEDEYSENIFNIVKNTKSSLLISKLKEIGFYES